MHSTMRMRPNYPVGTAVPPPLLLDGRKDLTLVSLKVNGTVLPEGSVQVRRPERRGCVCVMISATQLIQNTCLQNPASKTLHPKPCIRNPAPPNPVPPNPASKTLHPKPCPPKPCLRNQVSEKGMSVSGLPAGEFELSITTAIKPQDNTLLEGLYKSGGNFSTQV